MNKIDACSRAAYSVLALCYPLLAGGTDSREFFTGAFYTPTDGRVGYHLVSKVRFPSAGKPGGKDAVCAPIGLTGWEFEGTLPPGVVRPLDQTHFEGTPRQPGTWQVQVIWQGVHCTEGPDQHDYGDRKINVIFNISP